MKTDLTGREIVEGGVVAFPVGNKLETGLVMGFANDEVMINWGGVVVREPLRNVIEILSINNQ